MSNVEHTCRDSHPLRQVVEKRQHWPRSADPCAVLKGEAGISPVPWVALASSHRHWTKEKSPHKGAFPLVGATGFEPAA